MCDAMLAREHTRRLVDRGWLLADVAKESGVAYGAVWKIFHGQRERAYRTTVSAILTLNLDRPPPPNTRVKVDATGTRRRVRALRRIGWPTEEIARRTHLSPASLYEIIKRPTVSRATHYAVAEVYERLSGTRGPSETSVGRAKKQGWPPPLAWDDDTIDDPKAKPLNVIARPRTTKRVPLKRDEIPFLLAMGETVESIAQRFQIRESTVHDAVQQHRKRVGL